MFTWSISTKPCPIITWDGIVFNGEHLYVDHICYMIHVRPFGLSVPRPYLHMLGLSSLTRVFCVCKTGLHPMYVNIELSHPVITRCLGTMNYSNGAYSGRTLIPWNLVRDHLIMLLSYWYVSVVSIIFDCSMPIFYNFHILLATFYIFFWD